MKILLVGDDMLKSTLVQHLKEEHPNLIVVNTNDSQAKQKILDYIKEDKIPINNTPYLPPIQTEPLSVLKESPNYINGGKTRKKKKRK